jgi:2-polyprenyl-3-methyl-5-hydroxy-6-metoxy-1,4-benzoquinol methylase
LHEPVPESIPLPPDELIDRVIAGFSNAAPADGRQLFLASGRQTLDDFGRALATVATTLAAHGRILEWGCGCGRVIRWMEQIAHDSALVGTDVDVMAITWASTHIPFARFDVNDAMPPTRYGDGEFDLVLNHSVFTHLDE